MQQEFDDLNKKRRYTKHFREIGANIKLLKEAIRSLHLQLGIKEIVIKSCGNKPVIQIAFWQYDQEQVMDFDVFNMLEYKFLFQLPIVHFFNMSKAKELLYHLMKYNILDDGVYFFQGSLVTFQLLEKEFNKKGSS